MGDPSSFQIRGGANPHTRDKWGRRKTVDRAKAMAQWRRLGDTLRGLGVWIFVLPAFEESPGMVFPANAGFLTHTLERKPLSEKTFYLSQSIPSRAREKEIYRDFVSRLGLRTADFPRRFEGEADFFEAGPHYIFTSGPLEKQRFAPRFGWPPYRRVYGFRSDADALKDLGPLSAGRPVLPLTLTLETHYHGDTCLCAFGKNREFLMAYLPAIDVPSQARLKESFGEKLLPLSEEDGLMFSANSFQVDDPEPVLVMPHTASARLQGQVRERGARVVLADVSEFMGKGGGSVKCMVGDLGPLPDGDEVPAEVRGFRKSRNYEMLFTP